MNIAFSACVLQGGRTGVASYVVNLLHTLQDIDTANTYDILIPEADQALIRDATELTAQVPAWLEADPATHFAQLLEAAWGNDARLVYERTRRLYVAEITATGLVTVQSDGADELPVPVGVPA